MDCDGRCRSDLRSTSLGQVVITAMRPTESQHLPLLRNTDNELSGPPSLDYCLQLLASTTHWTPKASKSIAQGDTPWVTIGAEKKQALKGRNSHTRGYRPYRAKMRAPPWGLNRTLYHRSQGLTPLAIFGRRVAAARAPSAIRCYHLHHVGPLRASPGRITGCPHEA